MAESSPVRRPDGSQFTVVALPDTQHYARAHPEIFEAQTRWIAAQRDAENVAFVVHEGDLVAEPVPEQLDRADRAMGVLDENDVPYLLAIGNHDYDDVADRDADSFERYFPASRFADRPWCGDSYDGTAYNAFARFEALGEQYLVMVLELFPREEVLSWAEEVLAAHPDREALFATHGYLYRDGTPIDTGDEWDRTTYDVTGHNGDELWERFLARQRTVRVVLCGHVIFEDRAAVARRTDLDAGGRPVHQLLANYQDIDEGGKGYLRLLRFYPDANALTVETYSPYLERYHPDPDHHFRIDDAF